MGEYIIKSRPKIPRNKYGYYTATSSGGSSIISTGGSGGTVINNNYYSYEDVKASNSYTGIINTSKTNTQFTANEIFFKYAIDDWDKHAELKFRLTVVPNSGDDSTGKLYMNGVYDITIHATRAYITYEVCNNLATTSYRPVYIASVYSAKSATYNTSKFNYIAISLVGCGLATNTNYKRDYTIQLLKADNILQYEFLKDTNDNPALKTASDCGILNSSGSLNTDYWGLTNIPLHTYGYMHSGDQDTIDRLYDRGYHMNNGVYSLYPYNIFGFGSTGLVQGLCQNSSTTTNKIPSTLGFNPYIPMGYYAGSSAIATSGTVNSNQYIVYHACDLRYNIQYSSSIIANSRIYLKMTLGSDGLLYLIQPTDSVPYPVYHTTSLPTTDDGYYYWFLGEMYNTGYLFRISPYLKIYKYDPELGKAVEVDFNKIYAGNIDSANGQVSLTQTQIECKEKDSEGYITNVNTFNQSGQYISSCKVKGDDEIYYYQYGAKPNELTLTLYDGTTAVKEVAKTTITPTGITTTNVNATNGNITTVNSTNINNSDTITTKNLKVLGKATFFELVIQKIKSIGGSALFTPADGFDIDAFEDCGEDGYCYLYWKCDDGSSAATNQWLVNDLALCQTFNKATTGTSHNVSNSYWWSLVLAVSSTPTSTYIDAGSGYIGNASDQYNWIKISTTDCDGEVMPVIGDSVVMCGYRGTDDDSRQSAIYIAAYDSIDTGLTAPFFALYKGINDFSLKDHRYTYFDADNAEFIGDFKVSTAKGDKTISDALLATGIDITNGLVKITSDNFSILNDDGEKSLDVDEYGDVSVYGAINSQMKVITSKNWSRYLYLDSLTGNYDIDLLHMPDVIYLDESLSDEGEIFENGGAIRFPVFGRYYDGSEHDFSTYGHYMTNEKSDVRKLIGRKIHIYNCTGQSLYINFNGFKDKTYLTWTTTSNVPSSISQIVNTDHIAICECCLTPYSWTTTLASPNYYECVIWRSYTGGLMMA